MAFPMEYPNQQLNLCLFKSLALNLQEIWKINNINNRKIQILKQECRKYSDTVFQQITDIKNKGKYNYHKNLKTYKTLTRYNCMNPHLNQPYIEILSLNMY